MLETNSFQSNRISNTPSHCFKTAFSLQYDIVGHSGDGHNIELVRPDKIPKNNKERLKVLKVQIFFSSGLLLKYI